MQLLYVVNLFIKVILAIILNISVKHSICSYTSQLQILKMPTKVNEI